MKDWRHLAMGTALGIALCLLGLGVVLYLGVTDEPGKWLVALLFALPLVTQWRCTSAAFRSDGEATFALFVLITLLGTFACGICLLMYVFPSVSLPTLLLANGSLLVASVLVLIGLALSSILLAGARFGLEGIVRTLTLGLVKGDALEAIRNEAPKHAFSMILFFLSVFLYVCYLLSFSLVFIDEKTAENQEFRPAYLSYPSMYGSTVRLPSNSPPIRFFFPREEATLEAIWPKCLEMAHLKEFVSGYEDACVGTSDPTELKRCNARAMLALLEKIPATGSPGVTRIGFTYLAAPAEETNVSNGLGVRRAADLQARLSNRLERGVTGCSSGQQLDTPRQGIEWDTAGVSVEDSYLSGPAMSAIGLQPGAKAQVQRRVEEIGEVSYIQLTTNPYSMDLLDYVYFMMYTITTTGYGDIFPSKPFSKFVVTLANIFELIFLVVFFNVIVSTRTPSQPSEASFSIVRRVVHILSLPGTAKPDDLRDQDMRAVAEQVDEKVKAMSGDEIEALIRAIRGELRRKAPGQASSD